MKAKNRWKQKCKRLQKRVDSLEQGIVKARNCNMISQSASDHLKVFIYFQFSFIVFKFSLLTSLFRLQDSLRKQFLVGRVDFEARKRSRI